MCANTCEAEQLILKALRNEELFEEHERIPSFVQSIMGHLVPDYFERFDVEDEDGNDLIGEDQILLTATGDYTIYKCYGYDSHWCGGPPYSYVANDALKEKISEIEKELKKTHPKYVVTPLGLIRSRNQVTHWYVGPSIKDEETLRFFMNNLSVKKPDISDIERWQKSRGQCMDKNWCQFISCNMVFEGGLGVSLGLISKLIRKNPGLLHEWYDLLLEGPIARFKAAVKAGFKLFCTADDMAYKTGPMMSPQDYRKFVTPQAKKLCDIVRDADGVVFMHTDGNIYSVIDNFIEAGYHAIQPLEPTSGMRIKKVKEGWGDQIACIGNCDTTKTLPFGTEQEVRQEVHRDMKEGRIGGKKGYVFAASGSLHPRIHIDNVLAMLDEWKKINDGSIEL
ncbi:MAG: hypothetical protein GF364_07040 [Candidatus Lokiarchaeota archaeon]|nr:hypothetical protein [Candidatus Lokiarchaeota archaeon]